MTSQAKRTRIDASARSPSTTASSPMAIARQAIDSSVESLHPEIAIILSRLGLELLLIHHKRFSKTRRVAEFDNDEDYIPISARCNFTLKCSKLVEQDEEYLNLVSDTAIVVKDFQKALRSKILETTKLEVKHLQKLAIDTFAKNLHVAVKAVSLLEPNFTEADVGKIVNTLIELYGPQLFSNLDITTDGFRATYRRVHSLPSLPAPFLTELPEITLTGNSQPTNLPPRAQLEFFPKLWRIVESIFISPFNLYIATVSRNDESLKLKELKEEHFGKEKTESSAMEVDQEPPADPELLKDLIAKGVDKATKKLTNEIAKLKTQLKNGQRDQAGASAKKSGKSQNQAAGNNNATGDGKKKNANGKQSTKKSSKSKKSKKSNKNNSNQSAQKSN